jgi:hypothetical protein
MDISDDYHIPPDIMAILHEEADQIKTQLETLPEKDALAVLLIVLSNYMYYNCREPGRMMILDIMYNSCKASFADWDREKKDG